MRGTGNDGSVSSAEARMPYWPGDAPASRSTSASRPAGASRSSTLERPALRYAGTADLAVPLASAPTAGTLSELNPW